MAEEDARKRWQERVQTPYEPVLSSTGKGIEVDAMLRAAHALEYIAGQLGRINHNLDKLVRK